MAIRAKTPAEWVEVFREEALREPSPEGSAAGGNCWLAHDGIVGVSVAKHGYAYARVRWADEEAGEGGLAHRATLAAVANGGRRLVSPTDGATMQVHHLCRRRNCVRPDHLEYLDGHTNRAEMTARMSVLKATQHMVGELESAHHDELLRRRAIQRELGRVRSERDEARAELDRARGEQGRMYERLETQSASIQRLSVDAEDAYRRGYRAGRQYAGSARERLAATPEAKARGQDGW